MSPWWLRPAAEDTPGSGAGSAGSAEEASRSRAAKASPPSDSERGNDSPSKQKAQKAGGDSRRSRKSRGQRRRKPPTPAQTTAMARVALLVDAETVKHSLGEIELDSSKAKQLKDSLATQGNLTLARVYGGSRDDSDLLEGLRHAGFEIIESPGTASSRTRRQLQMAVDAMAICLGTQPFDTLVLVTDEDDWEPLTAKLKALGKKVVAVGPRATASEEVVAMFECYLDLQELFGAGGPAAADVDIEPSKAPVFELLVETIERLEQASPGMLWGSMVKRAMHERDPEFDEVQHGYETFSDLLEDADRYQVIQLGRDDRSGNYYVVSRAPSDVLP